MLNRLPGRVSLLTYGSPCHHDVIARVCFENKNVCEGIFVHLASILVSSSHESSLPKTCFFWGGGGYRRISRFGRADKLLSARSSETSAESFLLFLPNHEDIFARGTNAASAGWVTPLCALFFQWLGVSRASDPPVPCNDCLVVRAVRHSSRYQHDNGWSATLHQNNRRTSLLSVRYRVPCKRSMIWYDMA